MPDKIDVFKYLGWCAVCWRCGATVVAGVSWVGAMALALDHVAEHQADADVLWHSRLMLTCEPIHWENGRPVRRPV